jgi:hypothetical protein
VALDPPHDAGTAEWPKVTQRDQFLFGDKMSKKNWIYLKRGLSEDIKHRNAIGECIWLFIHIIDYADWETGIVYDWKDDLVSSEMTMPVTTLRKQRRKLEEQGYIAIQQKQHSLNIIVNNWTSPRDYSGKVLNPQGDHLLPPSTDQGDRQGDRQGVTQTVTPTSDSISLINKRISPKQKKYREPYNLEIAPVLASLCQLELNLSRRECFEAADKLRLSANPPTKELLLANFSKGCMIYKTFPYDQGQPMSLSAIIKHWPRLSGTVKAPKTDDPQEILDAGSPEWKKRYNRP